MSNKKTKFCSHCGSSVNIDDIFCNNCGASLSETVVIDSTIPLHQQVSPVTPHVVSVQPPVTRKVEWARISLIVGAIAFVISNIIFVRFICLPLCLVAVIFGAISLYQKKQKLGFAIEGIILAVLAFASYIIAFFIDWWMYVI